MTDQQLLISTIREGGRIIAEHLEPGAPPDAAQTLSRLIGVLDTKDLTAAIERLDKPFGTGVGSISACST
jgi:hypothetical protein